MTIKPFAIQGADLTLGGVNLQAGTTTIVIPGVTQATSYKVDEVNDTDVEQTQQFTNTIAVIDYVTYQEIFNNTGNGSSRADYITELDDDNYIDDIEVGGSGSYTQQESNRNGDEDMYAYNGAGSASDRPIVPEDWVRIPFRPKMRAGEVETIGGGTGGSSERLSFTSGEDESLVEHDAGFGYEGGDDFQIRLNTQNSSEDQTVWGFDVDGDLTLPNGGAIRTNYGYIDQDTDIQGNALRISGGNTVVINTSEDGKSWEFDSDGHVTFPDGTVQTTAYTGQTSGGTGELYIMANVDGNIVTSTNGIDWTDPQPSGMDGIGRVEIHGGVIVYITNGGEGPPAPGLYYSTQLGTVTLCAGTAVSVETGNNLYWNEVHYFSGTDKWVAVGYNAGGTNAVPVLAHSDNGIDWTIVFVDNTFVTGFNPGNDNWELKDITWLDETNQYIITSSLDGELFGGIFLTADITTALDGDNHVAIDLDAGHVAPWSVQGLGGPPGYVVLIPADNDGPGGGLTAWFGAGTNVEGYSEDGEGFLESAIRDQIGYMPNITEVVSRNGNFIAVTNDGHVITPVISMGPEFAVTIPLPFTSTTFSITNANPAVISFPSGEDSRNNEKIEVTLAGEYNGTYYVNEGTGVLYTDQAMTTALDASGFASFTTGTVTFSHGMYFDAAGVSSSYYYIGNDDEQIFRSSNGVSWTQQADFTGEYFNDFAYGSWGTSATSTAIPNTKRGWINLVGDKPNNEDDAWFESVVVHSGYAYVLGSDQYIDNSGNRNKVYKFDVATSEQVWVKQITAGRNATFDLTVDAGVVTISAVATSGVGYKVGEEIVIQGYQINGSDPQNNVTLIVDSIDVDGEVLTASVKPGYTVVGLSGTFTGLASNNDDARGDACAIAYDEYNQKLVVVTQYESGSGDVTDSTWTWANVYMMNPTTGAIDSTTTISEDGDIYPNSITTHNSAGGIAIVGEKYNEYREFGTLTLSATYNGYFDILKTELDAEHYPGAPFNDYSDFWITGTGITGQTQVNNVNYYENLSPTTREGNGAVFDITNNGNETYSVSIVNGGTNYLAGHKIKVLGSALGGVDVTNDIIITVDAVNAGVITSVSNAGTATATSGGTPTFAYSNNASTWQDRIATISADGTKIFAISGGGNQSDIYQATLGSAWDASSVTPGTSGEFPFSLTVSKTNNLALNADGTRLYTLVSDAGIFPAYMTLGTAYDVTTLSGTFIRGVSSINDLSASARSLVYSSDGTKAYVLQPGGSGGGTVYQYNLNSAYDLDSFVGTADAQLDVGTLLSASFYTFHGFNISADGTTGYTVSKDFSNNPTLHQFSLTTPFDISTATTPVLSTTNLTTAGLDSGGVNGGSIMLKADNTRMLITGPSSKITQLNGTVGGGSTTYDDLSGTNYNVGSGATFTVSVNPATGAFNLNGLTGQGSNYVVDDVLIIPGTAFAGGTSPANDATLVVAAADVFGLIGDIVNYAATGTGPTNAIRVFVNGIDFTVEGSWSMRQNLGGEAFIWTPTWSNAIGGPSGDRFMDVCWEDAGTALYAVGRGRYEVDYTQALVVKFNDSIGAVMWSKDIKFSEAGTNNREARAVCLVPGSTDILVAGAWYNNDNNGGNDELILTRMTDMGDTVWQKTYSPNFDGNTFSIDWEISLKPTNNNVVVSFEQGTDNSRGLAYMIVDTSGQVVLHRVVSADGNSNYNYYDTPTANFADIYTDENLDQYIVMAGHTYVPSDNYYNALLMKLPLDGLKDIAIGEKWSIGEHIMTRHDISVTTVTSAFDSFTPTEHEDTMTNTVDARNYTTRTPDGLLNVWTHKITDDAAGYLEFGDGSKQSFATNIIPQIPAANDYWLTTQDSGKHIFFEHENGAVYIPHSSVRYFPVGFTFTIVNTSGSNCYLNCQGGEWVTGEFKLAGRNITTSYVGIPDSGSGSMVTVMKIKDGYTMSNSDNDNTYPDIWIVSGPGDVYNAD